MVDQPGLGERAKLDDSGLQVRPVVVVGGKENGKVVGEDRVRDELVCTPILMSLDKQRFRSTV